jgi:PAT family beta-lactamase induction signal transducer AmpG
MSLKSSPLYIYSRPRILAVFFLGIASGLPLALIVSTLSVWLTEVGVSKTAIGLFAAVGTPYALKFLWSPLIDQLPLPIFSRLLGRRRGWLVFTQICLAGLLFCLGASDPTVSAFVTALFAFLAAIASASQDVVIDAYRVEMLKEEEQGAGAAMIVFGYRVGMLLSGAGALALAQYLGWFATYTIMAMLVSIGTITVLIAGEPNVSAKIEKEIENIVIAKVAIGTKIQNWFTRAVIEPFSDFMKKDGWVAILLFVVLYKLGDAFAGVMTNPFLVDSGFSKLEIAAVVKTFGFGATIVGALFGGIIVARIEIMRALLICGIMQMLSTLMFVVQAKAGYNVQILAVAIAAENFTGGMGTTAFVAYISSLCNTRYTATQYALFSSLAAFGRTWLSASSGWFVDQIGWAWFFVLSTAVAIPGLVMIGFLRRKQ